MIRFLLVFLFLIIGCQNNWSIKEKNNFKARCMKFQPKNQTLDSYADFCDCILMESMNLNLSYNDFLKSDSNNLETESFLKSCISSP